MYNVFYSNHTESICIGLFNCIFTKNFIHKNNKKLKFY